MNLIESERYIHNKCISKLISKVLKINDINNYYQSLKGYRDIDFTTKTLKSLNIIYNINKGTVATIPEKGSAIVASNHPTGALDGILLTDLILKRRNDLKIMGNSLLSSIEPLRDYVINVEVFENKTSSSAVKQAIRHLQSGGILLIFPSAEVSTYYGKRVIEDKRWSKTAVKFLYNSNVPIIPIHISAKNSTLFHILGIIHPMLRTIQLARELSNKQNSAINISIASALSPRHISQFRNSEDLYKYIRANIYMMGKTKGRTSAINNYNDASTHEEIISETPKEIIIKEIDAIKERALLFSNGTLGVLLCEAHDIKNTIKEIGRLREITFREVGEGTGLSTDIDSYDTYYRQLIIWDSEDKQIIGGYRVGMGHDIINSGLGTKGFYCSTLFDIKKDFNEILDKTIELGRSFIRKEYQKRPILLLLLWKGILYTLLKNEQYRYLFGPVSISGDYSNEAKNMIMSFIKAKHFSETYNTNVIAKSGTDSIPYIDCTFINRSTSMECVEKLINDTDSKSMPILLKKYIQLGGEVITFNVDAAFNNSLDAFLLLDVAKISITTLGMLSKELHIDDVTKRFYNINNA